MNYRAWGIPAVLLRGIPGNALRAFLGSFRIFSWNFFRKVPAALEIWPRKSQKSSLISKEKVNKVGRDPRRSLWVPMPCLTHFPQKLAEKGKLKPKLKPWFFVLARKWEIKGNPILRLFYFLIFWAGPISGILSAISGRKPKIYFLAGRLDCMSRFRNLQQLQGSPFAPRGPKRQAGLRGEAGGGAIAD